MQMMEDPEAACVGVLAQLRLHIQTVAAFHDLLTRLVKDESSESIVSATAMLIKLMPMWQKIVGTERFRWSAGEGLMLSVKKGMSLVDLCRISRQRIKGCRFAVCYTQQQKRGNL